MAAITRSRVIPVRAEPIWDVLADFGALSDWVDGVAHSCLLHDVAGGVGTSRRVQTADATLVETITEFTAPSALAYDISGLPPRLRGVRNRWTLAGGRHATDVMVTSTFDVDAGPASGAAEWVVGRVMAKMSDEMLAGLTRRMETADG
jgi:hypothetical protein